MVQSRLLRFRALANNTKKRSVKGKDMTTAAQAGYVVGSDGKIYVQVRDDSQFGFSICDDEQSWAGGLGSGLTSWTLIASDDSRITDNDRDRLGWILDEQPINMPAPVKQTISVQWEFMGRATQEHFDAAQAVADAMESCRSTEITRDIIESACDRLGQGWDYSAVLAMIKNCSFELIDQEASADAQENQTTKAP